MIPWNTGNVNSWSRTGLKFLLKAIEICCFEVILTKAVACHLLKQWVRSVLGGYDRYDFDYTQRAMMISNAKNVLDCVRILGSRSRLRVWLFYFRSGLKVSHSANNELSWRTLIGPVETEHANETRENNFVTGSEFTPVDRPM